MKTSELAPGDYHSYYQPYIDALGEVELMDMMQNQLGNFPQFMEHIPAGQLHMAYAPGKWTIAEVLLHVIDAERVFQYRALRIARGDTTPLPGFEQDAYVAASNAGSRSMESLIEEYKTVRQASLSLFNSFAKEHLQKKGTASNVPISVAALGFIICGHQKHHRNIIRKRYLLSQSKSDS